ncbi:MAG: hypothetical protein ACR2M1_14275 [Gemmatimonadaceae bacterium]
MRPSYAHEDVGSQSDRRLLVISYFFPPDAAVGARRWEKLCLYAAERGWGIDVIMNAGADFSSASARLSQLPSGIRLYSVAAPEIALSRWEKSVARARRAHRELQTPEITGAPSSVRPAPTLPGSVARAEVRWALHTQRGILRLCWAWLDYARTGAWSQAAVCAGSAIFQPGVHRAVIATSPPFMAQEAARALGGRCRVPFVVDMRDPWLHIERLTEPMATPLWLRLAAWYESRAVAKAALIVANTELARRQLAATYPDRAGDIITVTNGSDEDPLPPQRLGGRFVIAHAGTVYLDRDPRALFVAAARVIRELNLTPDEFGLSFIGDLEAVGGFPINEVARQEGISDYVDTGPLLPHAGAIAFMSQATMLVTMSGSSMAAVPAKTFECARFPAWLLALSVPGSATELLLQGTGADVISPSDVDGIAAVIRNRYAQHRDGVTPAPVGADTRFSRRFQANVLFDALEKRLEGGKLYVPRTVALAQQSFKSGSGAPVGVKP